MAHDTVIRGVLNMRTASTNIVSDGTVMDHTSRVKGVIIIRERERKGNRIVVDCIIRIIVKERKILE